MYAKKQKSKPGARKAKKTKSGKVPKKKTAMRRGVEVEIEEFSSSDESEEERKERIAKMKADLRGKWGSMREEDAGATSC